MKPLYVEVEIKTEDDLPEKHGDYFVYLNNPNESGLMTSAYHYYPNDEIKKIWMKDIWGYLRPITEEEVQNILCIYPRIKL